MKRYAVGVLGALLGGALLVGATAQAQQSGTIEITAPADNATVGDPVMLNVNIQGVTVKPAAEGDPQAFHYHALVDVDPSTVLQPGQPIPTGQGNIIHTADSNLSLGDLAPGQHSVTVVLTRTDHVPLSPNVQDRVTFTVAPAGTGGPQAGGAQTPAALARVGTGGPLTADGGLTMPLLLALTAVMLIGMGGTFAYARRRR
jgi:hypothetical protein